MIVKHLKKLFFSAPPASPEQDVWQGNYEGFTEQEMRCKGTFCDCKGAGLPRHSFMLFMVKLRKKVGTLPVSSGYRCPAYNKKIGGEPDSAHVEGLAADIPCSGLKAILIIVWGYLYGARGFGISQKSGDKHRFIHIDKKTGDKRPAIWSY